MRKYRVAFVTGVLVGLTAVLALLTGGDMWFVILLIWSSTILTTVAPPADDPEALRENWHFSLVLILAAVGIAIAAILARGPLFGTAGMARNLRCALASGRSCACFLRDLRPIVCHPTCRCRRRQPRRRHSNRDRLSRAAAAAEGQTRRRIFTKTTLDDRAASPT